MNCNDCYWCVLNHTPSNTFVCCNEKSNSYNQIFQKEDIKTKSCNNGETRQAVDYRNMTAWQFASKYYM